MAFFAVAGISRGIQILEIFFEEEQTHKYLVMYLSLKNPKSKKTIYPYTIKNTITKVPFEIELFRQSGTTLIKQSKK